METPKCAICLLPLRGRGNFVIVGTEVVHRACATTGSITQGWKTRQALADAMLDVAKNTVALEELVTCVQAARDEAATQRHRADALDGSVRALQRQVDAGVRVAAALRKQLEERESAIPLPVIDQPAQVINTAQPSMDDTEKRFSLLELDPL